MRRNAFTLALVLGGCTTDFFLEGGTDATTAGAGSSGSPTSGDDPSTTSATTSGEEGSTDPTEDPTTTVTTTSSTTESEASGDPTTETTEGDETTSSTTGDPTSAEEASAEATSVAEASAEAGAEEGGGDGGVLDCPEIEGGQEGCEATPACDWYGEGPCFADACHPDAGIACDGYTFDACPTMPLCTWFGVEKEGECGLLPCTELDGQEACLEAPHCAWVVGEPGSCMEAECPGCYELGELDCMETDGCTWLGVQESCAPD